jgi:hypothetical protein
MFFEENSKKLGINACLIFKVLWSNYFHLILVCTLESGIDGRWNKQEVEFA